MKPNSDRSTPRRIVMIVAFVMFVSPALLAQESRTAPRRFDHEHVLGTSMHLETFAGEAEAAAAEKAVLEEIERLRRVLSTYDATSELAALKPGKGPVPAGDDLRAVLSAADRWTVRSKGAFDPGVARFAALWADAAKAGRLPADADLAAAVARAAPHLWKIDDGKKTVECLTDLPVTLDALAKGYVIDRAVERAVKAGAKDACLMIGGDLKTVGERTFAVADPRKPADNAEPRCRIKVKNAAVATSAGYARGFDVLGKHYSHIFDPRTGRPVEGVLQATVVAPEAVVADALATIANVLAPAESLALIATVAHVDASIIDAAGAEHATPGWKKLLVADEPAPVAAKEEYWIDGAELRVSFEIQKPAEGGGRGGYRRPYVACWVEDAEGKTVATLCLWVERDRWIPDLRRWGRLYDGRYDDVVNVTRATRAPGKYDLVWEGRNDFGGACMNGTYTVFLEAVREHGTYQVMQQKITIDGKEKVFDLKGGVEIKSAKVSYVPPKSKG